jgi:hypothetical protein
MMIDWPSKSGVLTGGWQRTKVLLSVAYNVNRLLPNLNVMPDLLLSSIEAEADLAATLKAAVNFSSNTSLVAVE